MINLQPNVHYNNWQVLPRFN